MTPTVQASNRQPAPAKPQHPLAPIGTLALLAGAVAVQSLTELPPWYVAVAGIAVALVVAVRVPRVRLLALALIGAGWTLLHAVHGLERRLPHALEGEDVTVVGTIVGLPDARGESTRFDLRVRDAAIDGLVRLSWYGERPMLAPCETWRLTVRLKRPRGLVNPGGFDFERYALQQGIVATGYVRDAASAERMGEPRACIDAARARIADAIARQFGDTAIAHLLAALAVGDQRGLDEADWHVLRATGVGHLFAISGFHIGMLAAFGALALRLVWRRLPRAMRRVPAPLVEAAFGLACAALYAALAGFSLPTVRTLAMIGIVVCARLARRHLPVAQGLALALVAILAFDPLAVLSASFWLSFAGVAWLVFCLGTQTLRGARGLVAAQFVATIALAPLSVWFFGQSSLVGPLANLVAVPWVSFVVVPLTVAGSLLVLVAPSAASGVLQLAAWMLEALWIPLERIAQWPYAQWYYAQGTPLALVFAVLGVAWLLLPRGVPARWLGAVLLLPLLWPATRELPPRTFEAAMLDVGQGLSVLVRTRSHALLYDAGARFPSGFDLGQAAVVPALRALGVRRLDRLMLSHGDNDHAGGATAVVASMQPAMIDSGDPDRIAVPSRQCRAGDTWEWDGVTFRVLHPADTGALAENDRSCVLLVEAGDAKLLLTGDVTAVVERVIARTIGQGGVVLAVPHHGSKTSSSEAFLRAIAPSLGLVSAGYRNRFGHPHPDVVARYAALDVPLVNTADAGCIRLEFSVERGVELVERCREARRRYWMER